MSASVASPSDARDASPLARMLRARQTRGVAQLFTLSDYDILAQIYPTASSLKEIFTHPNYAKCAEDQRVVELVLSRITAAIRDSNFIESHAAILVDLLEACLSVEQHRINTVNPPITTTVTQPQWAVRDDFGPRCKIALELLSTLFLYHSKQCVMALAIPVAIRVLVVLRDVELARHVSSYLSLAAIHNARTLAEYTVIILANIFDGNLALIRVLPQLYSQSPEQIHARLGALLRILRADESGGGAHQNIAERLCLLQLAALVADANPTLILSHLSDLDEFLRDATTRSALLHVYLTVARSCAVDKARLDALRVAASVAATDARDAISRVIDVLERSNRTHQENFMNTVEVTPQFEEKSKVKALNESPKEHGAKSELLSMCSKESGAEPNILRLSSKRLLIDPEPFSSSPKESNKQESFNLNLFDTISGRFIDSAESLCAHKSSATSSNFPNDPAPSATEQKNTIVQATIVPSSSVNLFIEPKTRNSLYAHHNIGAHRSLTCVNRAQHAPNLGAMGTSYHRDRNASDLLSFAGEPRRVASRAHNFASNEPKIDSEMFEKLSIQMGRDGRVRPASMYRNHAETITTVFPVSATAPPSREYYHSSMRGEHYGSCNAARIFVDEHQSAKKTARAVAPRSDSNERGDLVKQFVENRRDKICRFVREFTVKYPIPTRCSIEQIGCGPRTRTRLRVHFACQVRDANFCVFDGISSDFNFKTKLPAIWMHLMFLQMEAERAARGHADALTRYSAEMRALDACWRDLPVRVTHKRALATLLTSAFPNLKEQSQLLAELQEARFFDSFSFKAQLTKWACFGCAHPERIRAIVSRVTGSTTVPQESAPLLLKGQLKERHGILGGWRTKFFTLSAASLSVAGAAKSCANTNSEHFDPTRKFSSTLDLRKIRSVKSVSGSRPSRKVLPRAFELFMDDNESYVLKALDRKTAEEWFQCLQVAVAHAQRRNCATATRTSSRASSHNIVTR